MTIDALRPITDRLDPLLVPLGFLAGQGGTDGGARGQVIYCRGDEGSPDGGCLDLVLDVHAEPEWRIVDVRWDGFPADRWYHDFERGAPLPDQVDDLAARLPELLS